MYFNENCIYDGSFDETKFIVGFDLGNSDSALSFYDFNTGKVEQLDISGGYGKASIPTVVQYIKDTDEWVFGEYALMNKPLSDSITFQNLISGLGKKHCYTIGKKTIEHSYILSLYIKEILGNIKNINPSAEIIGIAVSVAYLSEDAENELLQAFMEAGYYDNLIGLFSEKQCIINKYCYDTEEIPSKIVALDFGSREIRGGFYSLYKKGDTINVNMTSAFSENKISTSIIDDKIYSLFEEYFKEGTGEFDISPIHKLQLEAFTYQHKDLVLKSKKGIKLYFNFVYPPFQKSVEKESIENITLEFRGKFYQFINDIFERANLKKKNSTNFEIDKVICCGGGFEMAWIKQSVLDIFGESRSVFYKSPKNILSQGACIIAIRHLGIKNVKNVVFTEKVSLTQDIGLIFKEKDGGSKFVPFIEKDCFWWQKFASKNVIINEFSGPPSLEIFKRNKEGSLILIDRIVLYDLPKRPKGTNCFNVLFECIDKDKIIVKIKDLGFGEFFKPTNYEKDVIIEL